eukprot:gb/GECH01014484.1/.p1 GENE.gb/GECH01014484.1/~~gb/GECH01014484.1/.p1  ORF type:complete len:698 (+),score=186.10 gb/GECH01014484.1/:1-2094(+)
MVSTKDESKKTLFTSDKFTQVKRLSSLCVSPNGRYAVFSISQFNSSEKKMSSALFRIDLNSLDSEPFPLTTVSPSMSVSSPTFSPDSKFVAFISKRENDKTEQIYIIPIDGGEAQRLSSFPISVGHLRWSPDNRRIFFVAAVYPDKNMKETAEEDEKIKNSGVTAIKYTKLPVRHWNQWEDHKFNHIFSAPVQQNEYGRWTIPDDQHIVDTMFGMETDCPMKPFGGVDDFSVSPDGRNLACSARPPAAVDAAWTTNSNIYLTSREENENEEEKKEHCWQCITEENPGADTTPVWSHDGNRVAYTSMSRGGYEADRARVKIYDRTTGKTCVVCSEWDVSVDSLQFTPDDQSLIVVAEHKARVKLFRLDIADDQVHTLVNDHCNSEPQIVHGNDGKYNLMFMRSSLTEPKEIFISESNGSNIQQITHCNATFLSSTRMSSPEELFFPGANNDTVQAWFLRPPQLQDNHRRYPVALFVHGGPQGAWLDTFHFRWNLQVFAAAGYVVLAVNFHGSTGFGQDFTDSIRGDWGGKPFEDLMRGLDYALEHYDFMDSNHMAALGGSYGGYMMNWINGNTDRFRCLVNHAGILDTGSMYYHTEELFFVEWELGKPWEHPELHAQLSPLRFVDRWQTPTLVIHGAKDYRVPETQGIGTFTALQRRGIPSELLFFPDEHHFVAQQLNSIHWINNITEWMDRWCQPKE